MVKLPGQPQTPAAWVFLMGWIAAAIIYTSHLDVIPVQTTNDECRRALVPLEMSIHGDYLRPTINGELYLNKPPLYSLLVVAAYDIVGSYSPCTFRLPMIMSLLGCGMILFLLIRRHAGDTVAALTALAFLTNGRALTYDTLLGLLEFTHSLFILLAWLLIFHFGEKRKYIWMFFAAYACTLIAFMLKGLPAIVHIGLGGIIYLWLKGEWRVLFTWPHLIGLLTFIILMIGISLPFILHNAIPISDMTDKLVSESTKRYDLDSFSHAMYLLYDFPLDFLRHFAPWTLLIILLFQRNIKAILKSNPLVWYGTWIFIVNIPIYWFASLKQPHYTYMLVAIAFMVLMYVWEQTSPKQVIRRVLHMLLGIAIIAMAAFAFYLPYSGMVDSIPHAGWLAVLFGCTLTMAVLMYWRMPAWQLYVFAFSLLIVRVAFNVFVIPQRIEAQMADYIAAKQIQEIVKTDSLAIYGSYPAGFYDPITYPLELGRKKILPVVTNTDQIPFLLVDDKKLDTARFEVVLSHPFVFADLNQRHEGTLHLVRNRIKTNDQ
jgi:4-amino-4-deoxy-L-arabinose transferase-like glycosyltransferase